MQSLILSTLLLMTGANAGTGHAPRSLTITGPGMQQASFEVYQLDLFYDMTNEPDSDWGEVKVTYTGQSQLMYLNVMIDGRWEIENIPMLSREGPGHTMSTTYFVDLHVVPGTVVQQVDLRADITFVPLSGPPTVGGPLVCGDECNNVKKGIQGGDLDKAGPGQGQKAGGATPVGDPAKHEGFPNQEAGENECVPTAVSNSLQFLKKKHNLTIPDNRITIQALKAKRATGWGPGGCPKTWWKTKKDYAAELGIETTRLNVNPDNVAAVHAKIKEGCDVEMDVKNVIGNQGHCVAIVGSQLMSDGTYVFEIAHDTWQGKAGGTKVESITVKPSSSTIQAGPPWAVGRKIEHFIVECPKKK